MKATNYRNTLFLLAVKAGILLGLALVILPYPTMAQCTFWDVSGKWTARVEGGPAEQVNITQSGKSFAGEADFYGITGKVTIYITGDRFDMGIEYHGAREGDFKELFGGKILPNGIIEGEALTAAGFDKNGQPRKWSSDRPMKCLHYQPIGQLKITPPGSPPPPVHKPILATGHPRVAPVAIDIAPAPAPMKVPGIIASLNNATIPAGKSSGKTTITWDAGRAHPYAEVWLKVDDQDETKVIESGKGSLQATIVPGKTYVYILTDAGTTLDTVTVKFHH